MAKLGVNVDHIATIRQARGGTEPDPITAAAMAELAGADGEFVANSCYRVVFINKCCRVAGFHKTHIETKCEALVNVVTNAETPACFAVYLELLVVAVPCQNEVFPHREIGKDKACE